MNPLFRQAEARAEGYREITVTTLKDNLAMAELIDVREPHEFSGELGHIAGSRLVPLATLESALAGAERTRAIVLVCRSGARSARAAQQLRAMGFEQIMNLTGGMIAWSAAGYPVARS